MRQNYAFILLIYSKALYLIGTFSAWRANFHLNQSKLTMSLRSEQS
jgi:hypothetical protein